MVQSKKNLILALYMISSLSSLGSTKSRVSGLEAGEAIIKQTNNNKSKQAVPDVIIDGSDSIKGTKNQLSNDSKKADVLLSPLPSPRKEDFGSVPTIKLDKMVMIPKQSQKTGSTQTQFDSNLSEEKEVIAPTKSKENENKAETLAKMKEVPKNTERVDIGKVKQTPASQATVPTPSKKDLTSQRHSKNDVNILSFESGTDDSELARIDQEDTLVVFDNSIHDATKSQKSKIVSSSNIKVFEGTMATTEKDTMVRGVPKGPISARSTSTKLTTTGQGPTTQDSTVSSSSGRRKEAKVKKSDSSLFVSRGSKEKQGKRGKTENNDDGEDTTTTTTTIKDNTPLKPKDILVNLVAEQVDMTVQTESTFDIVNNNIVKEAQVEETTVEEVETMKEDPDLMLGNPANMDEQSILALVAEQLGNKPLQHLNLDETTNNVAEIVAEQVAEQVASNAEVEMNFDVDVNVDIPLGDRDTPIKDSIGEVLTEKTSSYSESPSKAAKASKTASKPVLKLSKKQKASKAASVDDYYGGDDDYYLEFTSAEDIMTQQGSSASSSATTTELSGTYDLSASAFAVDDYDDTFRNAEQNLCLPLNDFCWSSTNVQCCGDLVCNWATRTCQPNPKTDAAAAVTTTTTTTTTTVVTVPTTSTVSAFLGVSDGNGAQEAQLQEVQAQEAQALEALEEEIQAQDATEAQLIQQGIQLGQFDDEKDSTCIDDGSRCEAGTPCCDGLFCNIYTLTCEAKSSAPQCVGTGNRCRATSPCCNGLFCNIYTLTCEEEQANNEDDDENYDNGNVDGNEGIITNNSAFNITSIIANNFTIEEDDDDTLDNASTTQVELVEESPVVIVAPPVFVGSTSFTIEEDDDDTLDNASTTQVESVEESSVVIVAPPVFVGSTSSNDVAVESLEDVAVTVCVKVEQRCQIFGGTSCCENLFCDFSTRTCRPVASTDDAQVDDDDSEVPSLSSTLISLGSSLPQKKQVSIKRKNKKEKGPN